jgi:hypothetical protein
VSNSIDVFVFQRYEYGSGLMIFYPLAPLKEEWLAELKTLPHILSIKRHSERFMQIYAAPIPEDLFLTYSRMVTKHVNEVCGTGFVVKDVVEPDYLFGDSNGAETQEEGVHEQETVLEEILEEPPDEEEPEGPPDGEEEPPQPPPRVANGRRGPLKTYVFRFENGEVRLIT